MGGQVIASATENAPLKDFLTLTKGNTMKYDTLYKRARKTIELVHAEVMEKNNLSYRELKQLQEMLQVASNICLDKIDELEEQSESLLK